MSPPVYEIGWFFGAARKWDFCIQYTKNSVNIFFSFVLLAFPTRSEIVKRYLKIPTMSVFPESEMRQFFTTHTKRDDQFALAVPAITAGLVTAQVIGSIQVGWSNRLLYRHLQAVVSAGYLAVPNAAIEPGLQSVRAALGGGLFFTLTIGALTTLLTIGWLRWWADGFCRPKSGMGIISGICTIASGTIIIRTGDFPAAAYLFFVPAAVCLVFNRRNMATDSRCQPINNRAENVGKRRVFFLNAFWFWAPLIILVWVARPFYSPRIFFDVRDRLLLSHPAGRLVNDFYYRYTLYPAESFKSLAQKQIRTFHWAGTVENAQEKEIVDMLVARDYLPVAANADPDLIIQFVDSDTLLFGEGPEAVRVKVSDFINRPGKGLRQVSDTADTHWFLRRLTYVSLVIGFPLLIYLMVYGWVRWGAGFIFSLRICRVVASVVCLLTGMIVLWSVTNGRPENITETMLPALVNAKDGRLRVAALKWMEEKQIDPSQFKAYPTFLESPRIVERYWVARALAHGHRGKIDLDLVQLLEDPSLNVVCMALQSLGQRGEREVIPRILDLMKKTTHWYVQLHAYYALKGLGWQQRVSH